MANEIQIPLDPNPLGLMEPVFFTGTITPLSQVYADFVRSKLFGKHVREALARGILIASIDANEAKDIARIANAKSDETAERQDELEERWETVLAETTDGAEVIDARTGLRGTSWPTIKGRLDSMQAIDDKLNPVSEIFSIEHNQNCYPVVRVLAFENGLGIGPLGVNLGGSNTIAVNCDTEYMGRNSLKVKVPLAFAMTNPTTERISANEYLLVEGIKSLIIEVGTKAEANVETFVRKEIKSDFAGKTSGSITENGNSAHYTNSSSLRPPDSSLWIELVNGSVWNGYDRLKSLDNVMLTSSTTTNLNISQQKINFNVLFILEKNFPSIFKNVTTLAEKVAVAKKAYILNTCSLWVKGSGPSGNLATVRTLNVNGIWEDLINGENTTNEIKRITSSSNDSNRITADGHLYSIVFAEASSGTVYSSVSIDYASITITARVPFSKI
ncbi:hypothetical protein [Carnobacterium maltaromaticum]|uniref:hypothetical protein n=1 Tax=Carnobacterium maltaromaticum TaxID=2751 RepID=UPI0039AFAD20